MNIFKSIGFYASLAGLLLSISLNVSAQNYNRGNMQMSFNIPALALIDFSSDVSKTITFSFSNIDPNQVEQIITPTTGDKTWLNYSSIVKAGHTNYITVHISSGSLPADVVLYLLVDPVIGANAGNTGFAKPQITLSYFPQVIIANIGSCYTGVGVNNGHHITYVWKNSEAYNYSLNYDNGKAIAVVYTISSTE